MIDRAPEPAAIRRALAECMTVADVDDALGWAPGTARRRRWRPLERGGLPASDAELGGVAIWFRATIEQWRADSAAAETGGLPAAEPAQPEPAQPEPLAEAASDADGGDGGDAVPVDAEPEDGAGEDGAGEDGAGEDGAGEDGADGPVISGYELEIGQHVLADIHGRWLPALVQHRDRNTVVVEYSIADGPLGYRQQRITLDRVRHPAPG